MQHINIEHSNIHKATIRDRGKNIINYFRFIFLFVLTIFTLRANAQQNTVQTTTGRDFWVGFLHNGQQDRLMYTGSTLTQAVAANSFKLVANSENAGSVTVTCGGWSTTATLVPNGSVEITVPYDVPGTFVARLTRPCYSRQVRPAGIHVTSTTDISLYALNYISASFDATTVLPTSALGKHYILQDYKYTSSTYLHDDYDGGEMCVVATENNTTVNLTFHSALQIDTFQFSTSAYTAIARTSHASGSSFRTITLQQGQYIQLITPKGHSFSGTEVNSSKPVAVFMGRKRTTVPHARRSSNNSSTYTAPDHLYEQAIPTEYWGKKFLVVPDHRTGGYYDYINIASLEDGCEVSFTPLNAGQNYSSLVLSSGEVRLSNMPTDHTPLLITATKPISVCLYLGSLSFRGNEGDPSSVIIPPIEQATKRAVFNAYNTTASTTHRANIVVPSNGVTGMRLDGTDISSQFTTYGTSGYSYAKVPVSPGQHVLSNAQSPFNAWFYGMGSMESYAYTAAMTLRNIVNPVRSYNDTLQTFIDNPLIINPTLNDTIECDNPTVTIITNPNNGTIIGMGSGSNEGNDDSDPNLYAPPIPGLQNSGPQNQGDKSSGNSTSFTYYPLTGFTGLDSLQVVVACDSLRDTSWVYIHVIHIPDNVLDPSCAISVDSNGFSMRQIFSASGVNSMSTPMVADMDGDGKPEIIACKNSANSPWFSKDFLVIDGVTGELKKTITTQEYYVHGQCITIADVDRDGESEIFMLSREGYVICYNYSGGQRWVNLTPVPFNYLLTAADIDGDSAVELVCGPYIFRASDGTLLLHGTLQETGMGFGAPLGFDASHHIPYYMYALADIDNDGYLELCAGNSIYNINLPNGNNNGGISLLRQASNDVSIANLDGQTFVCDFDGDGDMDVCVIGTTHDIGHAPTATSHTIYPYVWDGQTGQIIAHASVNVNNSRGTSIPSCADLDGDGLPEIIFSIYGKGMYAYSFDSTLANNMLQKHHHAPFGETSGFTVFDFNQDGRNEIIHRGTSNLYVVDGTTLTPLTTPITSFSGTIAEYPVVADVNGDGIAEIVVTHAPSAWNGSNSSGYVTVYGSNVYSVWSSARRVWNQWAYNTVGINQDLTVPSFHFNVAFKFPNGRQPYNNFLGQAPYINRQGDMFNPVADIYCDMVSTSTTNDSTIVQLNIVNGGALTFFAPFGISVYRGEYLNQLLFIDTVRTPILPFDSILFNLTIPLNQLCPLSQNDSIVIVLNDYASGIAMYGGLQAECDTLNNLLKIATPAYHNSGDTTAVACGSFSWQNTTYTSSGDIPGSVPLQNSVGCDSTSTLHLTIVAEPSLTTTADTNIPQGDTLTLRAWGGDIFSWTDTSGNVFANGDTVNVAPQEATKYIVSAYVEGINIVFNGDFEMGNTGFTCGHDYNSFAYEGAYYIGTNARNHFPSFAIWHDHTSGSGQYMIVNGAGTPNTVAWSQTVDVTPNTDYAFSTWISNLSPREYASGNLNDVSQLQFSINGSQLGDIFYVPETAGWVRVYKVWNSGNANSATISILNQNSGWAGNDFGMDDIRFAPVSCPVYDTVNIGVFTQTHENISVCENMSPILWHGLSISAAGTYYDTIHGPEVDTVAILDLTINYNSTGVDVRTTCDSLLWIDGITYSSSNSSATHNLYNANINGCDSIVTLNLTLNHSTTGDTTAVACDSLIWKNVTYTSSGDFNYSGIPGILPLQNAAGCDSTVTLHLTINHSSTFDTIAVVCDSTIWHGAKYYISQDAIFRTKNIHNCDSVETLHLTVNNSSTKDSSIEACNSFTWGNNVLTSSWSTVEHLTNVSGCDSTLSVNVTVFHCSTSDTTAADSLIIGGGTIYADTTLIFDHDTIIVNICHTLRDTSVVQACNSYSWQNTVFTSNAFISDTTHMNDGCDSIHFLDLTIFHCSTTDTTAADSLVIAGGTIYADTTLIFGHDTIIVNICHTIRDTSVAQACNSYTWNNSILTSNTFVSDTTHMNDGCDSIHFLDLTIHQTSFSDTSIIACDTYTWIDGVDYSSSTIPQSAPTYTIPNGNMFGCDSTIRLSLTINHSTTSDTAAIACNSFTIFDSTFNTSVTNTSIIIPNSMGCDSIVSLSLTILNNSEPSHITDTTTISNMPHSFLNVNYSINQLTPISATTSQILDTFNLVNTSGCDSIIYYRLTVLMNRTDTIHRTICDNQLPYIWDDSTFTEAATKTSILQTTYGTDSIVVRILHVNNTSSIHDTAIICSDYLPYSWHDTIFDQGSTSGSYLIHRTNSIGCDSTIHLSLTIAPSYELTETYEVCQNQLPFVWHNITLVSETATTLSTSVTLTSSANCDSTILLLLTIKPTHSTTDHQSHCEEYMWIDGNIYSESTNQVSVSLFNQYDCDSVVTLDLVINHSSVTDITDSFCVGTQYIYNGQTLTDGGYFVDTLSTIHGCDSIVRLALTMLQKPVIDIEQHTDCETRLHFIHLATNVDYIQWSTNGNWNNAWGPDNSRDLVVNAPQPIVLSLFVDYNDYPSCPNNATITMDPIIIPTAIIKATPEFLTNDESTLYAISNSTGADWLQWFINSEDAGGANSIQYTIDRNEDSVVLLLIAHNSANNNACFDSTTKTIYVHKQTLYAPNVFTPDESTNNIFNIFYDGVIEYELNIYNREGIHVFHSSNDDKGWDGTHNGKRCPQASYVWIVRYRSEVDPQNWHTEKGTVLLIR